MIDRLIAGVITAYSIDSIADLNLLPMVFRFKNHNHLDLAADYNGKEFLLPARGNAKNMSLSERLRRYIAQRRQ